MVKRVQKIIIREEEGWSQGRSSEKKSRVLIVRYIYKGLFFFHKKREGGAGVGFGQVMRAGGCTLQQTLTSEAASVLKHSLSLARRRGHAQVTPLHVAATLLTSKFSLLRRACLKSQSQPPLLLQSSSVHPLHQSRALELCFNVALNRLPTIPGPLLHHGQPSFSNALIAALKRAQAHQRRGCIEQQQQHQQQQQQQQQQPLLAIKVELEQLILSILDDPSVSRVMREAGFSSTAVKTNLEEYCSVSSVFQCYNNSSAGGGIYSTPNSPPSPPGDYFITPPPPPPPAQNQKIHFFSPQKFNEDIKLLEEVLLQKKRRNTVIVGDSLFVTENLVSEFMSKVESGDVPEGLKSVYFIKFQFSEATLKVMKRDEVEINVSELKRKVENLVSVGRGVIIYIGNLKWTVEENLNIEGKGGEINNNEYCGQVVYSYSPVDHLVAEIGKLVSFYSNSTSSETIRFWLLATANYQTYMRCQMKQPALDIQWSLQAVSVPSGGLGLSLNNANNASVHDTSMPLSQSKYGGMETKTLTGKEEQDFFTCCPECTSNYEKELASKSVQLKSCKDDKTSNEVPHWLNLTGTNVAEKEYSFHLKRKWSKLCQSLHTRKQNGDQVNHGLPNLCSLGKNYSYSPHQYWWPSYNRTFLDTKPITFASNESWKPDQSLNSVPRFRRQQSCHIEFNFSTNNGSYSKRNDQDGKNLNSLKGGEDKEAKITLALGSSLLSHDGLHLTQLEGDNINGIQDSEAIRELLKENVPWQSKNIPGILEALKDSETMNKDIWLLFQGNDSIGKQKLALGIAKKFLGSTDLFVDINIRKTGQYREILENALRNHDRLVVLLENIEFADTEFLKFLADGWRSGKIGSSTKNGENPRQVIFILSKLDSTTHFSHGSGGKWASVIEMKLVVDETRTPLSGTFSSDHKRKVEWDFTGKTKNAKQDNIEEVHVFASDRDENGKKKLSSNILDLNVKAEEEENQRESKELSSITTDIIITRTHHLGFLDLIKNRFLLNRESTDDKYIKDLILSKIEGSFEKVFGNKNKSCFSVEGDILEKMIMGYGSFLDTLFEKWLKDIFQTSLNNIGRIEGVSIKLCLGSNYGELNDMKEEKGFMGSCLPKNVQVMSFLN